MNLMTASKEEVEKATRTVEELTAAIESKGLAALTENPAALDTLLSIVAGAASLNEASKMKRIKTLVDMERAHADNKMG